MKKRVLATVMSLALGLAMLTACGAKDDAETGAPVQSSTFEETSGIETTAVSTEAATTEISTEAATTGAATTEVSTEAATTGAATTEVSTEDATLTEVSTETAAATDSE